MAKATESMTKDKALALALANIEKQFGKGTVMKMDGVSTVSQVPCISTGMLSIDEALGGAGVPVGRVIEIFGPESSGKTTLTLHVAAECQANGGTVAFVDAEHALDLSYAARLGVDVSSLLVSQPDCGEQALAVVDMLTASGAVDLIIVDSVAALTPRKELEGDMGDSHMGLQARLMSQGLRKLTGSIHKTQTTVIFINQLRMKIGVMFGNPETTTGGNALKFYASTRIDIRRIGAVKVGDEIVGNRTKIKIVKNKIAPPFKVVEFDLMFKPGGFDKIGDVLDLGVREEFIEKAGAWFSYNNAKLGQGREKSKQHLRDTPELLNEIRAKIIERISPRDEVEPIIDPLTGEILE